MVENDLKSFAKSLGATQSELLDSIRSVTDFVYRHYGPRKVTKDDLFQDVMLVLLGKLEDSTFPPDYIPYPAPYRIWRRPVPRGYFPWPPHPFSKWVYVVARNRIFEASRKNRRLKLLTNKTIRNLERKQQIRLPQTANLDQLNELIVKEDSSRLRSELANLPDDLKNLVSLVYLRGFRVRDVASQLMISESVVHRLLHRAVKSLASRLSDVAESPQSTVFRSTLPALEVAISAPRESVDFWLTEPPPLRVNKATELWMQIRAGMPFLSKGVVTLCAYMFSTDADILPRYQDCKVLSNQESDSICFQLTPRVEKQVEITLSLYLKANMLLIEDRELAIPVLSESSVV